MWGSNSSIAVKARQRREAAAVKRAAKQRHVILRKVEIIEKLQALLPPKQFDSVEQRLLTDVLKMIRNQDSSNDGSEKS